MVQFFKASKKTDKQPRKGCVVALDHQLQGVVREQSGGTRFVAGALPGEQITYKPLSKFSAELLSVKSASTERIEPPCPYYQACGGCDVQHLNESDQQTYKQAAVAGLLQKFAQTEQLLWQPTLMADAWGYRRKARLATFWDGKRQHLRLGFRAAKSKQITEIANCLVLRPSLSALIEPLRQLIFDTGLGRTLGHIELIQANVVHVVLRVLKPLSAPQKQELRAFAERHSLAFWLQDDNSIASVTTAKECNDAFCYDQSIDGDRLYFTPGDFIQVNADVNEQMVRQALAWLAPESDAVVLDLFAGVGNFSLPLARRVKQVIAIEGVAGMSQQLADNAQAAGCDNLTAETQDLSQIGAKKLASYNATHWLLDPARAGADKIVEQLGQLPEQRKPKRIVYVSCAPDTLARDSKCILAAGYRLKQLGLVDMFPQTHHIETMVCFERVA